jgi:hypothetical protein
MWAGIVCSFIFIPQIHYQNRHKAMTSSVQNAATMSSTDAKSAACGEPLVLVLATGPGFGVKEPEKHKRHQLASQTRGHDEPKHQPKPPLRPRRCCARVGHCHVGGDGAGPGHHRLTRRY